MKTRNVQLLLFTNNGSQELHPLGTSSKGLRQEQNNQAHQRVRNEKLVLVGLLSNSFASC